MQGWVYSNKAVDGFSKVITPPNDVIFAEKKEELKKRSELKLPGADYWLMCFVKMVDKARNLKNHIFGMYSNEKGIC